MDNVGGSTTNLTAMQNGVNSVLVSWTAAPGGGTYRVTAYPGGVSMDTPLSSLTRTLQPGVHNIMVMTHSTQHYQSGGTAGPLEVTVRGK